MFETDKEVLDWYERQPRSLSKEYVNSIRWKDIKNYEINPAFVPVLIYMRDIEYFTDMYYQELRRTPTGKDPVIRKFMDRWSIEELHHGNLLNRFLEEAGFATGKNWQVEATRKDSKTLHNRKLSGGPCIATVRKVFSRRAHGLGRDQ